MKEVVWTLLLVASIVVVGLFLRELHSHAVGPAATQGRKPNPMVKKTVEKVGDVDKAVRRWFD